MNKVKILSVASIVLAVAFTQTFAQEETSIRYGVRGNIGTAFTGVEMRSYSGDTESVDGGIGVGLGGFALIPVFGIYFVPDIALQHREVIKDFNDFSISETGIDVSLLFRFRYREENLIYLGVGPYFGVLLAFQEDGTNGTFKNHRPRSDVGATFELGFRINNNFSIDLKWLESFVSIGLNDYLKISGDEATLGQFQIGLNYTF